MDEALRISRDRARRRFLMPLFAFFALCGLVLSAIFGARTPHILHVVLRELLPVALLGVGLGLALTKYAIPLLGSQALFDARFNAPLFAATSTLVVVVLGACLAAPAFRATRVPTSEALRSL